jgi:hypothetical protein
MKAFNSTLRQLIEGTKVFAVPLYQRRYSWERKQWKQFWQNVLEQYENSALEQPQSIPITHFIGSFVLAPAPGAASAPTRYVLIDGQQRLTTTMVLLAALRDLQGDAIDDPEARLELVRKFNTLYLHNAFETSPLNQLRLLPTQQDRHDYQLCVGQTPADPTGRIGEAYNFFRSTQALRGKDLRGEPLDLDKVSEILLTRMTLVEITTELGDNVHRIFQTLNSAGVKLKQVDLLRNHFFMLLPTRGETLYSEVWREMELRLGENQLDRFFWADLVRGDPRVSRSDVYASMQVRLDPISRDEAAVEAELRRLDADSCRYLALVEPVSDTDAAVEKRLSFLRDWGSDTARPLMLELLVRLQEERLSVVEVIRCLDVIESFLVRRMIVGIPTNNLNRIFSSLTPTLAKREFTSADISQALGEGQKYWPSDDQLKSSVMTRPFYYAGQPHQRRQVLEALNESLQGKEVGEFGDDISIEHIMPQSPTPEWLLAIDANLSRAEQLHDQLVHTLGNLTLTGFNPELSNHDYASKRRAYSDSALALNRAIAAEYTTWNDKTILDRGAELADLISKRWPGPESSSIELEDIRRSAVEDALLLLPTGAWTTYADLSEFSGLPVSELQTYVASMPGDIAPRVSGAGTSSASLRYDAGRLASLTNDQGSSE